MYFQQPARHTAPALKGHKRGADNKENTKTETSSVAKKCKVAPSSSPASPTTTVATSTATAANMATVNITISNYIPLHDIGDQYQANVPVPSRIQGIAPLAASLSPPAPSTINSPTRSTSSPDIEYEYLPVGKILQEIHDETVLRHYNLPQYQTALVQHGIVNVNDAYFARYNFLTSIGFPSEDLILKVFRDRAGRAKYVAEGWGVSQPRI